MFEVRCELCGRKRQRNPLARCACHITCWCKDVTSGLRRCVDNMCGLSTPHQHGENGVEYVRHETCGGVICEW